MKVGLVVAKSGRQSAEEQVTEPILGVGIGGLESLDISTFGPNQIQAKGFVAESVVVLQTIVVQRRLVELTG